jgi:hypothetical protein
MGNSVTISLVYKKNFFGEIKSTVNYEEIRIICEANDLIRY